MGVLGFVSDLASDAYEGVSDAASNAYEGASEIASDAYQGASEVYHDVAENLPDPSLLVAAATGSTEDGEGPVEEEAPVEGEGGDGGQEEQGPGVEKLLRNIWGANRAWKEPLLKSLKMAPKYAAKFNPAVSAVCAAKDVYDMETADTQRGKREAMSQLVIDGLGIIPGWGAIPTGVDAALGWGKMMGFNKKEAKEYMADYMETLDEAGKENPANDPARAGTEGGSADYVPKPGDHDYQGAGEGGASGGN